MEPDKKAARERSVTFDVMNILSCIGVIALHHNGLVHTFHEGPGWVQALVIECLFYFSVPVFMMISGANLMGYRERYGTKAFLKKRFVRTVIPWLFWSVVFLFWNIRLGEIKSEGLTAGSAIDMILNSKVMSVYWFFPALFMCYLTIPVLSAVRKSRKLLWYVTGVLFLYYAVKPLAATFLDIKWNIDAPLGAGLLIFVVLGYLLTTKPPEKRARIMLCAAGAACVIFRFVYTLILSEKAGVTDTSIKGYSQFHSVFYACAVFVLLSRVPWDRILPEWLKKRLKDISACSLGIYLIHRMVMRYEGALLGLGNGDFLWRSLCVVLTYAVCLGIVAAIRKIPGGKYIAGG